MLIKTTGRGPDYGKNLIQRRWAFLALLAVGATGLVCYFFLVPGSGISGHARGFYLGGASGITGAALANLLRNEWMLRHPSHRPGGPSGGGGDIFSPGPGRLCPGGSGPDAGEGAAGLHAGLHPVLPRRPGRPGPAAVRTLSRKGGSPVSHPNPIPPMTEEERAAFRSFLLRRYVLSILALVLGIAGAVLLLRRGVDGPPLMEAVWVCLFVLSGGTAVLGGRAWGRYQTLLTEPEAMERTWQARRAGPQTEADQSYRRDVSRSGRLGLLLLAAALLLLLLGIPLQAQLTGRAADVYGQVIFCLFLVGFSMMAESWHTLARPEELRSARVARDDERSQEIELRAVWKAARATQTALFLGLLAAGWLGWSDVSLTLSIVLFFYFSALAVFRARLSKRM